MPIYTFYPTLAGGLASSFEALELPDDEVAIARAATVLEKHQSAFTVVIWEGGRQVGSRQRVEEGA